MNYEERDGGYLAALEYFMQSGGQLFPARDKDGASTVLKGRTCVTFWEENSALRANVRNACKQFGFNPENMTAGRLAKRLMRDIVGLETKDTCWGKKALRMAKDGGHWHYLYVETGYHPFLIEFDLKSAYFSSLFSFPSLLYDEHKGFINDSGSMDVLKQITPDMPKWLRLVILGILASHKQQFYTLDKDSEGEPCLKLNTLNKISYGAAFNCAHKAISKTYQCMQKVHSIGGNSIKRIHTDSFALEVDCDGIVETSIMEFLDKHGYLTSVKGYGSSHFLNLNEGLIGKKLIGVRDSVFEQLRSASVKIPKVELTEEQKARWNDYLYPANSGDSEDTSTQSIEDKQLTII